MINVDNDLLFQILKSDCQMTKELLFCYQSGDFCSEEIKF